LISVAEERASTLRWDAVKRRRRAAIQRATATFARLIKRAALW
jgi:hypothetical protein